MVGNAGSNDSIKIIDCRLECREVAPLLQICPSMKPHGMSKKRKQNDDSRIPRGELFRELCKYGPKSNLTHILQNLRQHGLLGEEMVRGNFRKVRGDLQRASKFHADAMTPYGRVIQVMHLGLRSLRKWEYIHPLALLHYLSVLSPAFGDIMLDSVASTVDNKLHVVLYFDEITPGNPFRPEKSRALQCIYWACLDWP